jgi:hypothetical protein
MQRGERRKCPTHGWVDALVTYADEEHGGPIRTVLLIECPECVRDLTSYP